MPRKDPVATAKKRFARLKPSQEFPALPGMNKYGSPPTGVVFELESSSSNPYQGGFIQMRFHRSRLEVRWDGETTWASIEWYELLEWLQQPERHVPETLEELKQQAHQDGYNEGLRDAVDELKEHWMKEAITLVRNEGVIARRAAVVAAETAREGFTIIRDGGSLDTSESNTKETHKGSPGPSLIR